MVTVDKRTDRWLEIADALQSQTWKATTAAGWSWLLWNVAGCGLWALWTSTWPDLAKTAITTAYVIWWLFLAGWLMDRVSAFRAAVQFGEYLKDRHTDQLPSPEGDGLPLGDDAA